MLYRSLDVDAPRSEELEPGTGIVIVRYLNSAWARALRAHQPQLAGVTYFMDDDLLGPQRWSGLPKPYIKKLDKYCRAFSADIRKLSTAYWMSTQALLDRYGYSNAHLLEPRALDTDTRRARRWNPVGAGGIQLFYHGSAAHSAEHEWLRPVIQEVLERCPQAHFEIIGDHTLNVQYRNLPRTRIVHPLSWRNYQNHCRMLEGHIGLAPLLPSPFNDSRSHVKVYDIARCGAAGLYSDTSPYAQVVSHGRDGMLLANEPDAWVQAICELVNDPKRLDALRVGASRFGGARWASIASYGYPR